MRTTTLAALLVLACRPSVDPAPAPTTTPPPRDAAAPLARTDVALEHPGCFTIVPLDAAKDVEPLRHEASPYECSVPTIPASTFKVPHALVALQLGIVTDPDALEKWDGTKQWMKEWERDHSLRTAIVESVVWFFQRTAEKIGHERMMTQLAAMHYGNASVTGDIRKFWLAGGSLLVTPDEQLEFLGRMFRGELPIDAQHVATVESILQSDLGRWQWRVPAEYVLPASTATVWAKTGTDEVDGLRVTWWVGMIEGPRGRWVFASRVRDRGELSAVSPAVHEGIRALDRLDVL